MHLLVIAKYQIKILSRKFEDSSAVRGVEIKHKPQVINPTFSAPDSDSEELNSAQGGWPPLAGTHSHGNLTRKRRSASSPTSLLSSQKSQKKKHKHLSLLLEEAGLSSSDDSFDQGY